MIKYYYPGDTVTGATTPDTFEIYLGASWKFLSFKYSRVMSDYFVAWGDSSHKTKGTGYFDLSAAYPLDGGWTVLAHVGRQNVKHNDLLNASYTDWKLGVSKDIGYGTVTLAYTDTNADKGAYTWDGEKVADGRLALSFAKTF
jgi:uncharacterized protein (TIGR02001 family)